MQSYLSLLAGSNACAPGVPCARSVTRLAAPAALIAVAVAVILVVDSSGESREAGVPPGLPGAASAGVYPELRPAVELGAPGFSQTDSGVGVYPVLRAPQGLVFPASAAVAAATRFASARKGTASFAVADARGGVRGMAMERRFRSASLTKAMILVAYLRKADREHTSIPAFERESLGYMIRLSDNASADVIYRRVGDPELHALARAAGMTRFTISGDWAAAEVTAADQARFFLALDGLCPPRYRELQRDLLERIMREQSWGVPVASRPRWRTFFKGGWRPDSGSQLVHQAAYLELGRRRLAIAVLTDGNREMDYGEHTIEGVARRLLDGAEEPLLSH